MGTRFDRIAAAGNEKLNRFYGPPKNERVCAYKGCKERFRVSGHHSTRQYCDIHRSKHTRDRLDKIKQV